ncbi:DUF4321 domain-containing protein [Anaerosacchariphilus polymeriproducens]|uniref:DUF4321 domain-containing protein n=1 Tax=Anaerosacchariphilus polymeriproducens TaxID=1812858 RepID=A0A371AU20_9FIRM|nr:DUF4321 domain-containing protein [Anaerosacchariphilus polymeriproducens]RDU23067.1 DUF4321 domain-containing protein [Anaerosacchariphilus polymeriproducens]
MRGAKDKNLWSLFLLLLAGIVLGGFLGTLTQNVSFLSWLNYGQAFGLANPVVLNLGILVITFGLTIKITIASIAGIFIAVFVYKIL